MTKRSARASIKHHLEDIPDGEYLEADYEVLSCAENGLGRNDPLDLTLVPEVLREEAQKCWKTTNIQHLLFKIPSHKRLNFVVDNFFPLYHAGLYEQAFVESYTSINIRMGGMPFLRDQMLFLLELADRKKLMAAGDPLPGDGPFTLYRGVTDSDIIASFALSWTASKKIATDFATKYWPQVIKGVTTPTVFKTTVDKENVFFYYNQRSESEFLIDWQKCDLLNRVEILP